VNQRVARGLLEKQGHSVVAAFNGREALDLLEQSQFDLVLMDIHMPEMDGVTATRLLRQREQSTRQHIPVIALTASAMDGDREQCLEAGMDHYISKPIAADEFLAAVSLVAARSSLPRLAAAMEA
jgi:CheY-like chemotaxis protein